MAQLTITDPVSNPLVGSTTLSGSIDNKVGNLTVASATGIVVPSLASGKSGSTLFINGEALYVTGAGTSTTNFLVKRGTLGTPTQPHLNAAVVWIGNAATSSGDPSRPFSGNLFPMLDANPCPIMTPSPAFGGAASSSAASVSGTIYLSAIEVSFARPVKGIAVLNGGTAGTDNLIVALYDFDGNLLANSALAGTLGSGTTQLQSIDFVTPIQISGRRTYFIAVQQNGTTHLLQKYVTNQLPNSYIAGSVTGGTFGTIPATLAIPQTFTTAKGVIAGLY